MAASCANTPDWLCSFAIGRLTWSQRRRRFAIFRHRRRRWLRVKRVRLNARRRTRNDKGGWGPERPAPSALSLRCRTKRRGGGQEVLRPHRRCWIAGKRGTVPFCRVIAVSLTPPGGKGFAGIWSAAIYRRFAAFGRFPKAAKRPKAVTTMSTWCPHRTPYQNAALISTPLAGVE